MKVRRMRPGRRPLRRPKPVPRIVPVPSMDRVEQVAKWVMRHFAERHDIRAVAVAAAYRDGAGSYMHSVAPGMAYQMAGVLSDLQSDVLDLVRAVEVDP